MNMAFGQRMGIPNPWGVAPGYGDKTPLAKNARAIRERILRTHR
jgi:hypothetical protein